MKKERATHSSMGNPMDRGAWWATARRDKGHKSQK